MNIPDHKTVKHYPTPGHIHELTFSCYDQKALLTNDLWCRDLVECLHEACLKHQFGLLAYVFMSNHVHLIVVPLTQTIDIPALLYDIKQPTSKRIKQRLISTNKRLLQSLTIQQRPGVTTFRFWQEGPGYDRNLIEPATITAAINYIHLNPVRRILCRKTTDWKWSSAPRLLTNQGDLAETPALTKMDLHAHFIASPHK